MRVIAMYPVSDPIFNPASDTSVPMGGMTNSVAAFPGARRRALVTRLWRAAERQMSKLEHSMDDAPIADAARDARALTSLARALRELIIVETRVGEDAECLAREAEPYDNAPPASLDEFRNALARQLVGLRGGGSA